MKLIKLSVSIGSLGGKNSGGVVVSRGRGEEEKERGIRDTTCGRYYSITVPVQLHLTQ